MIGKLAYRNIIGAGFRTWLNVFILSLVYFGIIALQGLFSGWQQEASRQIKEWDIAGGQYWHENYDPYDPFSYDESHSVIPEDLIKDIETKNAIPILLTPATVYSEGRMQNIVLKGIDVDQTLLKIPTQYLSEDLEQLNAIIGSRMAKNMKLHKGDYVTVRWRDKNGTFDAIDVKIAYIFQTSVLTVDNNQIWIALKPLRKMLDMPDEASIIVVKDETNNASYPGWERKSLNFLLQDLNSMIQAKTIGSSILYILLLFMALIAIFDTQILSIFRRRKEMGTMMALGMTREKIIQLFTLEGVLHAILAIFIGAIYGIPLLKYFTKVGMNVGTSADDFGLSGLSEKLYPEYGWKLVLGTVVLVLITVTIVSFLPTRKIARLKPTDALRGKMTK